MNFFPKVAFEAIVLVEIMTWNKEILPGGWTLETNFLARGAASRRDIWASKEDAYKVFKSRAAWKVWDDRVLRIYVVSLPVPHVPRVNFLTIGVNRTKA